MVLVVILSCKLLGLKSLVVMLPSNISQVYITYTCTSTYYGGIVNDLVCLHLVHNGCWWLCDVNYKGYEPATVESLSMRTYGEGTYRQTESMCVTLMWGSLRFTPMIVPKCLLNTHLSYSV